MPSRRWSARLVLVVLVVAVAGCRGKAAQPTVRPDRPVVSPAAEPKPAAAVPAADAVVVEVEGVPVREAELTTMARGTGSSPPSRSALVGRAIERRLIEREGQRLGVTITDEQIDQGLGAVAAGNGLTVEALKAAAGTVGWTWAEYRAEIGITLLEGKLVLLQHARSAPAAAPLDDATYNAVRTRLLGCLLAGARVTLRDPLVVLPDNPFAVATTVEGVRITGEPGLPVAELEAIAKTAGASRRLCDSLEGIQAALLRRYRERGYLAAEVWVRWPALPEARMTLDVAVTPGRLHVFGPVRFDQSGLPASARRPERELRRLVSAQVKPGAVASDLAMEAAASAVRAAFVGGGTVTVEQLRKERKQDVQVELAYHVGI